MPLYDFHCCNCGDFEEVVDVGAEWVCCSNCSNAAFRVWKPGNIRLKGGLELCLGKRMSNADGDLFLARKEMKEHPPEDMILDKFEVGI